uniref:Condensin-2 complex subunit H2 C-terminal domain-containing protein n=2 Tax=Bactrocera latifrons TaxID=174628 RepID=A0A0K8VLJ0_BACLA
MIGLDVDHNKALDHILQAANKHPNSRVSKLIHSVEEERSQKNIVLLLIELAEHAEYATDFSISLKYYLDLFEKLGIEREIVLNEAGLLLLNSSKVYARRVDFVQELVERQILTLSNADKEIVENGGGEQPKKSEEKPKRTRKRLVATVEDPFEVELVPRKFRKLTEEKRFVSGRSQEKQKMVASRFYKIDSEQYIHPAAWTHACIVDLENEEDIDSKRNYKLFTYHVEHRYNTLVTDINFRMHFKVKDYIDEEEERLERNDDSSNNSANILKDWPPLSEEYVKKYLDLENKALAVGEVKDTCKKLRIDREDDNIVIIPESVQNHEVCNESNVECNQSGQNTTECNSSSIQCESGVGNSINESNVDLSTKSIETTVNEPSEATINSDIDLSVQNIIDENSCLNLAHNLNSTEKSILELNVECESTFEASGISPQNQQDYFNSAKNTLAERTENDTGLGAGITNESRNGNDIEILNKNTNILSSENAESNSNNFEYMTENKVGNNENEINLNKIRVYLPHLDDEGVYFSDLDDQEHRMLSPRVVTTDVFPCIPNKKSITIIIDDEIRSILNIADEEPPPTYTMPIQVRPSTPPINLNIFKFHEKLLRRRILFKLGPEMELFLQSHSMKKSTCMDANEQRQYRPMKLFNESQEVNVRKPTIETDNDILSDGEDVEDFLGFTEEEQLNKNLHRLSRDSGVDADVALTTNVCEVNITCDDLNNISRSKELISTSKEAVDIEHAKQIPDSQNGFIQDITCQAKISTSESQNSTNELTSDIHISANNTIQYENEASSHLLFEDVILCTDNVQELENSRTKIQKWHEYLQPILSKARDRHHFDVFQLGTEIMNELQKPEVSKDHIKDSSITFQDMMANKAESYVSRYFLSTLLLANQNNIKIDVFEKCSEKPSAWSDIKLSLLNTKRHTVAIEDNIGIIYSKKSNKSNISSHNLKEPFVVISGGQCNERMNENGTVSNDIVEVDLNVVRPLKQIEKQPNINDDYDSGIFSSEECSS